MSAQAKYDFYVNQDIPYKIWSIKYSVSEDALLSYHDALVNHIGLVNRYGTEFGVEKSLLAVHDKSKWTKLEYPHYANRFHGNMVHSNRFVAAVNHHVLNNQHHPEYWNQTGEWYPMPRSYVLEMIADWHAASFQYTGSDNIQDWLNKKFDKSRLHPRSIDVLRKELKDIGYDLL